MLSDLNSVNSVKKFFNSIGTEIFYSDFVSVSSDFRDDFLLSSLLINLDNNLFFIFFCFNSRLESPVLNSRLRKLYLLNDSLKFFGFGLNNSYLNLPIFVYGNSLYNLLNILRNKISFVKDVIFNSYNFSIFNSYIKKDKFIFFLGVNFFFSSNLLNIFKN
jgi:hypothetical protein